MERNILLKSLGWGILVAEVPYGPDGPEQTQDELVSSLSNLGLQGVLGIFPDPEGAVTAVVFTSHGQEPCPIERDLMGPEEAALLKRLVSSLPDHDLRQRIGLLGIN